MDSQWFALATAGAGVTIGWILSQTTEVAKAFWGRKRRLADERRDRVLAYLGAADDAAGQANGMAAAYAIRATGATTDDVQLQAMVLGFNDAFARLERLRIEAHLLGPDWLAEVAVGISKSLQVVQSALRHAELTKSKSEFDVLVQRLAEYRSVRRDALARAKAELT